MRLFTVGLTNEELAGLAVVIGETLSPKVPFRPLLYIRERSKASLPDSRGALTK